MPISSSPQRYRFSTDIFHRMAEAGIFPDDAHVELIEGELIEMSPIGSRHASMVMRLVRLLTVAAADQAIVSPQNPIMLSRHSEPEPDIALLRPKPDFYQNALPNPEDILLLIEVADTSVRYEKETKIPLYARHRIPEVWLIDLQAGIIEMYRQPGANGYRQILQPDHSEQISSLLLPAVVIAIADLQLSADTKA